MSYRARSDFEREILEKFDDKLDESEAVSDDVREVISGSLERTTISNRGAAEEIAEDLIDGRTNASE